jgi:DNA-binding NarL/FixJ family response regulator
MIRILLADDQSLIRRGLRALLKTDAELEVIGEAENGLESVSLAETLQPDLVIMDIRMPVMDGVAATQEICQRCPQIKVLVLTTFDDCEYVSQALRSGASGYLLKDTPFEELTQTIRLILKGYTQLGPGLTQQILGHSPQGSNKSATNPSTNSSTNSSIWKDMNARDLEIVRLIAQGASNREISKALFIAEKTVKNRITNILSILNLRDRTQLAILALQKE